MEKTKKRIFISMPMVGRSQENIDASFEKAKKYISALYDDKYDISFVESEIDASECPYTEPEDITYRRIWFLAESIKVLGTADMVVVVKNWDFVGKYPGCEVEQCVAMNYDKELVVINGDAANEICPDLVRR